MADNRVIAEGAEKLAGLTGWKVAVLPIDPPAGSDAQAYFSLIDRWVETLSGAR